GISRTLGLRARSDGLFIVSQTSCEGRHIMWLNELWQRWLGRRVAPRRLPAPRRRGLRLCLEQLEARTLPSNFTAATVSDLFADMNAAIYLTAESDTITLVAGKSFTLTAGYNTIDGPTGLPFITADENLTIIGNGDIIERSTATGTP